VFFLPVALVRKDRSRGINGRLKYGIIEIGKFPACQVVDFARRHPAAFFPRRSMMKRSKSSRCTLLLDPIETTGSAPMRASL
jgi:hypothetical protein